MSLYFCLSCICLLPGFAFSLASKDIPISVFVKDDESIVSRKMALMSGKKEKEKRKEGSQVNPTIDLEQIENPAHGFSVISGCVSCNLGEKH